ncbi:hypothetical protein FALBO_9892 [Fusarium albosuccineum]|uniref:SnoaL-like domain-containing protein n=1 Tax=Fusarium albosuccineum TaxID=1237068 RepID=A0A8H4L6Z2_9HYPO|nr:hypothetical protein FALBO_9892 [Fusarium albosuccineum]
MSLNESSTLFKHLCKIHHDYRQTSNIDEKAVFYSPECRQICRQDPSYAAQSPDTIVRYLSEAGELVGRIFREAGWVGDETPVTKRSFYTVRAFSEDEANEFGTAEVVTPAGFSSADELKRKAKAENWTGLRVNMWTDDDHGRGLLVKVKYWWRLETPESGGDGVWKQVLHDILYLGIRDGTEESDGGSRIED